VDEGAPAPAFHFNVELLSSSLTTIFTSAGGGGAVASEAMDAALSRATCAT